MWSAADSQASFLAQEIQLKWEVLRFLDWYAFLCKPTRQLLGWTSESAVLLIDGQSQA